MKASLVFGLVLCAAVAQATTYYKEEFLGGDKLPSNWVESEWKKSEGTAGKLKITAGEWYGDKKLDAGLQTSEDARFYTVSSKIAKPFSNVGKDLVFQFAIKHGQKIDCGGGYLKLMPSSTDQAKFNGDSPYFIMFGPDVCGTSTRRVHVIFNHNDKNHLVKKDIRCETDQLTHVYTLIVRADKTYEVRIDNKKVEGGKLEEHWDFLAPKMIKDPSAKKPADWVDEKMMADPTDSKPENWDDEPAKIADPSAEKPEDWDEEGDGAWEAPQISNPQYKGEWKAKQIPNPAYKGEWVHPEIANPDYHEDSTIGEYSDIGVVGLEIWQVKAGSIFDNILVTDSVTEAEEFYAATNGALKDAEKTMFDEQEKAKREKDEAERKRVEEERKKQEKSDDDEDDEEDDEDEEDDDVSEKIKAKKGAAHEL